MFSCSVPICNLNKLFEIWTPLFHFFLFSKNQLILQFFPFHRSFIFFYFKLYFNSPDSLSIISFRRKLICRKLSITKETEKKREPKTWKTCNVLSPSDKAQSWCVISVKLLNAMQCLMDQIDMKNFLFTFFLKIF